MKIIFDMDNTLTDLKGKNKRPNIDKLLAKLKDNGHSLTLWTNSPKFRAQEILRDNDLVKYFSEFLFREDYDPKNKGLNKDIRKVKGDLIIDDDPIEIKFNKKNGKRAILVKSFMSKSTNIDEDEYITIIKQITTKKPFCFQKGFSYI